MYGIGLFEIFVIFLVLFLFFKPSEIMQNMRKLGRVMGKWRQIENEFKKDMDAVFDDSNNEEIGD